MTDAERILELDKKATPGPWALIGDDVRATDPEVNGNSSQMGDYKGAVICDVSAGLGHPLDSKFQSRSHAKPETLNNACMIAEYRTLAPKVAQENIELNKTIDRLRGQLQNCINHLDRAKRKYPTTDYDSCIESANRTLYETLAGGELPKEVESE